MYSVRHVELRGQGQRHQVRHVEITGRLVKALHKELQQIVLSAITAWAAVSATARLMPRQVCIKRLIQEQAQVTADDRSAGQASRPSQMVAADRL